jgi:UDP-N-acetylmuramoylalanine--D-glutamate ligase
MHGLDDIFRGKKITQMGLGTLGRGIGDAAFLARHGADLLVTDLKPAEALTSSLEQLQTYTDITYRLGEHRNEDFMGCDLVLKGAGVPVNAGPLQAARKAGVPVDMSASLFARIADIPMVGVTGTRGKSTVTHLVDAILKADGRNTLLGGNVRGVSNLDLLDKVASDMIGVFELDSWQCQGFAEEHSLDAPGVHQGPLSPAIAVFTTFMPDHMTYYHDSMEQYLADKVNIFLHQSDSDVLVLGKQMHDMLGEYKKRIRAHVVVADEQDVPQDWTLRLLGVHNRYNAGLAVAVARELGVAEETIRAAVEAFAPIPGRLQHVRTAHGVSMYNDTNATTPDAAAASLHALDPEHTKKVVLIAGGVDKNIDVSPLIEAIEQTCARAVLLPGTGRDALLSRDALAPDSYVCVESLKDAFKEAWSAAQEGDVLLLSPGFASHNLFQNEYDRGEQFECLVQAV